MSMHAPQVASAQMPSTRQMLFMRYFTAILIDLVVLNLFDEYWDRVTIGSFTVSLFAAVVLQVLLQATLRVERAVAGFFEARSGGLFAFLRWVSTWLVLFLSKLVILYVLHLAFGDQVAFGGRAHGMLAFIVVVVTMLAAEELVVRFYRRLA